MYILKKKENILCTTYKYLSLAKKKNMKIVSNLCIEILIIKLHLHLKAYLVYHH